MFVVMDIIFYLPDQVHNLKTTYRIPLYRFYFLIDDIFHFFHLVNRLSSFVFRNKTLKTFLIDQFDLIDFFLVIQKEILSYIIFDLENNKVYQYNKKPNKKQSLYQL